MKFLCLLTALFLLAGIALGDSKTDVLFLIECGGSASFYPIRAKLIHRQLFPERTLKIIHIYSLKDRNTSYTPSMEATKAEYHEVWELNESWDTPGVLDKVVEKQKSYLAEKDAKPLPNIGGMEEGAYYADKINGALGVRGNDPSTVDWRREKAAMQIDGLAGSPSQIPTLKTTDHKEVMEFILKHRSHLSQTKPLQLLGSNFLTLIKLRKLNTIYKKQLEQRIFIIRLLTS